MGKENIRSNELKRAVCLKTSKFEFSDVSEEELAAIYELGLRGIKFNGEETEIDVSELLAFPALRNLSLNSFHLESKDLDVIRSLGLRSLQLGNVGFDENTTISCDESLSSLIISDSEGLEGITISAPEFFKIVDSEVDISKIDLSKVRKLYLQNCTIRNFSGLTKYDLLDTVNLDGSTVLNVNGEKVIDIDVRDRVQMSFEEEFLKVEFEK